MQHYRAPRWLPGGTLQTIWPALVSRQPPLREPAYRRERWATPDGDFIDVDFAQPALADAGAVTREAALLVMFHGLERVLMVPEDAIKDAMRLYFSATHNVAEGAGAIALAALCREKERMRGKRIGVILSGGNIDRDLYASILNE